MPPRDALASAALSASVMFAASTRAVSAARSPVDWTTPSPDQKALPATCRVASRRPERSRASPCARIACPAASPCARSDGGRGNLSPAAPSLSPAAPSLSPAAPSSFAPRLPSALAAAAGGAAAAAESVREESERFREESERVREVPDKFREEPKGAWEESGGGVPWTPRGPPDSSLPREAPGPSPPAAALTASRVPSSNACTAAASSPPVSLSAERASDRVNPISTIDRSAGVSGLSGRSPGVDTGLPDGPGARESHCAPGAEGSIPACC
mmetsp:Transcript_27856/g.70113  ORF Transcript_27856/g.70113 Transcript_27856/m.70113 type:complete len:271 (-) Transcript_27856:26-838(-)